MCKNTRMGVAARGGRPIGYMTDHWPQCVSDAVGQRIATETGLHVQKVIYRCQDNWQAYHNIARLLMPACRSSTWDIMARPRDRTISNRL